MYFPKLDMLVFSLQCLYTRKREVAMQELLIPLEEEIVDIAEFFKVFGDPTRLKILFLLEKGELGVNTISESLGMQQSTISQQLKLLRARRLVRFRKEGRNVVYRLNDEHIHSILALGMEHYEELF
ncbi:putative transcriptional regulator [Sphaerochaeta pleomorpha str. Grapes]|uniref:Putative transcriptional regulator n=2 Tax=Sphaerochaeta TaxID=399320 RepID=G8QY10_SPHPG|nr:putative transcriptional regulator [Sphaerochaeta pleomorpha str. Grapes]